MGDVTESSPSARHLLLHAEYEQTNENFRALAETRFKLIRLLPLLGGVAVFGLAFLGLTPETAGLETTGDHLWLVLGISLFGFVATLGITCYDQRNSELYNALIHRAKFLEKLFKSPVSPGARRVRDHGGQFLERPKRGKTWFGRFKVGHDTGLALIYGPVLGAWWFPFTLAVGKLFRLQNNLALPIAVLAAVASAWVCISQLNRMDDQDRAAWEEAARQAGLGSATASAEVS